MSPELRKLVLMAEIMYHFYRPESNGGWIWGTVPWERSMSRVMSRRTGSGQLTTRPLDAPILDVNQVRRRGIKHGMSRKKPELDVADLDGVTFLRGWRARSWELGKLGELSADGKRLARWTHRSGNVGSRPGGALLRVRVRFVRAAAWKEVEVDETQFTVRLGRVIWRCPEA
jgi:hypothetical protein